ncbi:MAG: tetratricopeptide repeat protein, partial [Gammaproteobacteria bacterium]
MNFWIVAAAIPLVAAVVLCLPLLRGGARNVVLGVAMLLLVPLGSFVLYPTVGTPEGIGAAQNAPHAGVSEAGQLEDALAALEQRLQSQPDDLEGWLLLARTYKTMQQHEKALAALRQAQSLDPDNPLVRVELAESLIFTSGGAPASDEVRQLLQSAVEAEPELQKGLWLLGVIAAQDGNDPVAIDYWQQLLVKLDPQGGVAQAVQREVDAARERLGMVRLDDGALPPLHPPVTDAPAPAATAATGTVTEMAAAKETASHPVTPPAMQDGWGGVT